MDRTVQIVPVGTTSQSVSTYIKTHQSRPFTSLGEAAPFRAASACRGNDGRQCRSLTRRVDQPKRLPLCWNTYLRNCAKVDIVRMCVFQEMRQ